MMDHTPQTLLHEGEPGLATGTSIRDSARASAMSGGTCPFSDSATTEDAHGAHAADEAALEGLPAFFAGRVTGARQQEKALELATDDFPGASPIWGKRAHSGIFQGEPT